MYSFGFSCSFLLGWEFFWGEILACSGSLAPVKEILNEVNSDE